jgi:superkiller protein 3
MKTRAIFLLLATCSLLSIRLSAQNTAGIPDELTRLIMNKDFNAAIRLGNLQLAEDSLNPQVHYYLGLAYSNLKQFRKAAAAFERSNSLMPGNRSLILNLSEVYCELADAGAAEILVSDLVKTDSTDILAWLELAQVYQRMSKTDEAVRIYQALWSADSSNIWYPRQIGMMLARNERYRQALPFLEYVVESDSSDLATYIRLGQAYVYLKADDKIPVLDKAIRQDSSEPLLFRYRGGLFLGANRFPESESDLTMAFELGDSSSFVSRHLGISQFHQSKYQDALQSFSRTVKIDSLDTEAWYYLGYCYKWTENIPRGIECMEHALRLAIPPSTGSIYSGLGLFHNLKGDFKTALIYYGKAIEYNPSDVYPYSQMGVLIEQTSGEKELAKKYYERFLKDYSGSDQTLITYVRYRLQMINEKLFMEGKLTER